MNKKILITIAISIITIYGAITVGYNLNKDDEPVSKPTSVAVTGPDTNELWSDINDERTKASLPTLVLSQSLITAATNKCADMVKNNYWSHNGPNNDKSIDKFIPDWQKIYFFAGENLLYGFNTSDAAVKSWMNSATHRANILEPSFTDVGYAVCHSDNYISKGAKYITVQVLGTR